MNRSKNDQFPSLILRYLRLALYIKQYNLEADTERFLDPQVQGCGVKTRLTSSAPSYRTGALYLNKKCHQISILV